MGRRENPVGDCAKSLRALATWLRAGREAAGLTYAQLAERCEFSADTLSRTASGCNVPRKQAVLAFAHACGLNEREAERLWKLARKDAARADAVLLGHPHGSVHISVVKNFADLHSALMELYHDDGKPPLRELDQRIGGVSRLPHSTTGRVLQGRSRPSKTFVLAFAQACGVRESELPEWQKAWERADTDRRQTRDSFNRRRRESQLLTHHTKVSSRDLQQLMRDLEASALHEPGLRLKVHIPDSDDWEKARMTRELLVDEAQRQGKLSCPVCHRPSFGYTSDGGWVATLCDTCGEPDVADVQKKPLPRRRVAQPPDRPSYTGLSWTRPAPFSDRLETLRRGATANWSSADAPTLELHLPDRLPSAVAAESPDTEAVPGVSPSAAVTGGVPSASIPPQPALPPSLPFVPPPDPAARPAATPSANAGYTSQDDWTDTWPTPGPWHQLSHVPPSPAPPMPLAATQYWPPPPEGAWPDSTTGTPKMAALSSDSLPTHSEPALPPPRLGPYCPICRSHTCCGTHPPQPDASRTVRPRLTVAWPWLPAPSPDTPANCPFPAPSEPDTRTTPSPPQPVNSRPDRPQLPAPPSLMPRDNPDPERECTVCRGPNCAFGLPVTFSAVLQEGRRPPGPA